MPCCELFDLQTEEYKNRILPPHIKKISVEAGATIGWYKYADYTYGIDTFGKSGNANDLRKHFKFTIEDIIKEIWCNYNKVHYFCGGIQKTTSLSIM
jgi:transketolase